MKKPQLHDLFVMELQDMFDAEQQLLEALPNLQEAASHEKLKSAFESHLLETENQIDRLEKIAEALSCELTGQMCEGMEGLLTEGDEIVEEELEAVIKDLALIAAAQKVEHYEISGYGTLEEMAKQMGHNDVAKLLSQSKDEEAEADKKLSKVADELYDDLED